MKFIYLLLSFGPLLAHASAINAIGRMERFQFEFQAKNVAELKQQCLEFATEQRIAHIDDIYISYNGHKRLHLHNRDGVWHYPKHICAEIEKVAQSIDLTPPTSNEFQEVLTHMNSKSFSFTGSHTAEVFNDCIAQLESNDFRETDFIRVKLNDRPWKTLRNNDSWWRGAQQVCTIIDQAIF